MVVPEQPFLLRGEDAIQSVEATPRWSDVTFSNFQINRPQEGLIVIAYPVDADRRGDRYSAYCTSTYRRVSDRDWVVIQHQQTPQSLALSTDPRAALEEAQGKAAEERESVRGYQ